MGGLAAELVAHRFPASSSFLGKSDEGEATALSLALELRADALLVSDDQQAEYSVAFSARATSTLVRKYLFVRLMSILKSAILAPAGLDFVAAERECRFLTTFDGNSSIGYATKVSNILRFLPNLTESGRADRLATLRDLHNLVPSSSGLTQGIPFTMAFHSPYSIQLTPTYLDHVTSQIELLKAVRRAFVN